LIAPSTPGCRTCFLSLNRPLHYVVLRVPPEEAVRRCADRTGDALRDPEIIADLHRQFADLGLYASHALNVTGLGPDAVSLAVDETLAGGAFRL
jgi:hypothetical protein